MTKAQSRKVTGFPGTHLICAFAPLFLLFSAAACADKNMTPDIIKVFDKHGYEECAPARIRELLRSKGFEGLKLLDRHAEVITARKKFKELPGGGGFSSGLLLEERRGGFYLAKVFRKSPGAAAGLRDGDRVLEVDGHAVSSSSVSGLALASAGFRLKVERRTSRGPGVVSADLKKEFFSFPAVFGFYEPGTATAFVRIGMFFQGSSVTVAEGLDVLSGLGAKKVIFDLRDSGGGVPDEAAGLLKNFAVKAGPVLEIRSRHKGYSGLFEAPGRGRFAALQPLVLVNSGTAMAAEVFAQSLRELRGARIVGETTRGSVSLQKTFRLGAGGKGLRLTVARMFPPSGKVLEEKGVEPDLKVELSRDRAEGVRKAWAISGETALLDDPVYAEAVKILVGATFAAALTRQQTPP